MRIFYPDTPDLPLPEGHRFPATKYRQLRALIAAESILPPAMLAPSPPADLACLARAHTPEYVARVIEGRLSPDEIRRIGLPWSETLVARSRAVVGGALAAARHALLTGFSGQLAGGTHHAHSDFGSGFCVFNDLAVAAIAMLEEGRAQRVAIIDLDVHQGDGNAAMLAGRSDVFVLSLHGAKNFPFRKVRSTLDIPLPDDTGDGAYLEALESGLAAIAAFAPDLVLYLAGVDPLASDRLGRLAMTHAGLAERDHRVLTFCAAGAIPVSVAIGGGYAEPITETVDAYANTFRVARRVFAL
ncbi:MAG: histone deacetylase [Hyphomicrobiaceae bacterium]